MKKSTKGFIKTKTGYAAWILAGLLAAWLAAAWCMGLSESQSGRICDFSPEFINLAEGSEGLEETNGNLLVAGPSAVKTFWLRSQDELWSYAYISLGYLNAGQLDGFLTGYDSNWQETVKMQVSLYPGQNEIVLGNVPLSAIQLQIPDQAGTQFYISRMEVTEFVRNVPIGKFLPAYLASFVLFLLLSGLALKFFQKRRGACALRAGLQILQRAWAAFADGFLEVAESYSEKVKSGIRAACFFGAQFTLLFVSKFLNYHDSMVYRIEIFIICGFIGIAAIMCLKRNMKAFAYKNPLAVSWYLFCVMMCLSDFVLAKRIMYTGYWLIFIWGFFFWAWNNMERPESVLKEWFRAFEAAFWISILFCLLCTAQAPGFYKGMTNNPNTLGQFMSMAITVFLGMLLEEGKKSFPRLFFLSLALDFSIYFTLLSQCRSGILADAAVAVLAVLWVAKSGQKKALRRKCLAVMLSMAVLWLPVSLGSEFLMTHNSFLSDHVPDRNSAPDEADQLAGQRDLVYASEGGSIPGKIMERFKNSHGLDQFSSGRLYIYKKYIENMNLFGHFGNAEIYGIGMGAHNSILMIGYRYGIFTIIPYLLMVVYSVWYSWRYRIRSVNMAAKHGFTINGLMVACLICGMLDHIEQPARYMPWLMQYILIGYFLCWDDKYGAMEENMQC